MIIGICFCGRYISDVIWTDRYGGCIITLNEHGSSCCSSYEGEYPTSDSAIEQIAITKKYLTENYVPNNIGLYLYWEGNEICPIDHFFWSEKGKEGNGEPHIGLDCVGEKFLVTNNNNAKSFLKASDALLYMGLLLQQAGR